MSEPKFPTAPHFTTEEIEKIEIIKRKNGHPKERSLADVLKEENRGSFEPASIDFLYEEANKTPEFTSEQISIMNNYAQKSGRPVSENPFETMRGFNGRFFVLMSRNKIYDSTPEIFAEFLTQIPEISETDAANLRKLNIEADKRFTYGNDVMSVQELYQLLETICDRYDLDIRKPISELLIDKKITQNFPKFNYSNEIKMPLLQELDDGGKSGLVDLLKALPDNFGDMLERMIKRDNEIILNRWKIFLDRNVKKIMFRKAFDGVVQPIHNPDYSNTEEWQRIRDFLVTGKSEIYGEADSKGDVDDEGVYRGLTYLVTETKKRDDYTIIENESSVELVPHSKSVTNSVVN